MTVPKASSAAARPDARPAGAAFDVEAVRRDFPILHQKVHGKPLVYLDNAATTQKPQTVIDATTHFYARDNSNIHRGLHALSERATAAYEGVREKVRGLINAERASEIVFTRGTTEGINLIAQTFGRRNVGSGDEVVISTMEHHSNIVPWQMLCEEKGASLRVIPINDAGELLLDEYEKMLGPRTKIVSIVHLSNALGTINPVKRMAQAAHAHGAVVVLDGAQAMAHLEVDVRDLGADFYAFSAHKMYGPTGTGVLYGRQARLEAMPPYQGGGDMISSVSFAKTTYNKVPQKFEAGTPNIAGVVGLGAAVDYLRAMDREAAAVHERDLLAHATEVLSAVPGVRLIGTAREKSSVVAFELAGVHPHDVGSILDLDGIAVRAGHHCTQPLMARYGVPATTRVSPTFYNTREEIEAVGRGLHKVIEMFR
jgi:cysteine desulfurase/selenocysteine lyase